MSKYGWKFPPGGGHMEKPDKIYYQTMTKKDVEERLKVNDTASSAPIEARFTVGQATARSARVTSLGMASWPPPMHLRTKMLISGTVASELAWITALPWRRMPVFSCSTAG